MGFFDIPAPVFSAIDGFLEFLPDTARLIVWATLCAAVSMYLYLKLSKQPEIAAIKQQSIAARKALNAYAGSEFDEMLPLAKQVLSLSGKHFMVVIGPAILSSLPALALIVWVSNQFGAIPPTPRSNVDVRTFPATSLTWSGPSIDLGNGIYTIAWPTTSETLTALNAEGQTEFALGQGIAPVLHKKTWWNTLIANPAGYLPDNSTIELVELDLTMKQFLPFGPSWLRDWAGLFFIWVLCVSITIKVIFKIN